MKPIGLAFLLSGCVWQQGALQPKGPKALAIAELGGVFLTITTLVFLGVVAAAVWAFVRGSQRAHERGDEPLAPDAGTERQLTRAVSTSTLASLLLLAVLLVASVATGQHLAGFAPPKPVRVKITAHQWWWQIEYPGNNPQDHAVTANELHVPAGLPVELELTSADVIHSFWLPNLDGKHDLIPSHVIKTYFQADAPGDYSGRCAEFCGYQHAHMDLLLVAQPPSEFQAWLAAQRQPAREPRTASERRGRELMEQKPCATCHTVSGSKALGGVGPDLSHLASRRTLAAGAALRDHTGLKGWLQDPNSFKPGTQMPAVDLAPNELEALMDYLESLQ
jgi:cytochrome c oxidase subunit 2